VVTRISGFASGMDIDSIVKNLMKAESMPLDKLKQKKQTLEWQRDDYRSINTLLLDFQKKLRDMALSSSYRARNTTSSNELLLSAKASDGASLTSSTIQKVTQLASAATMVNGGKISNGKIDPSRSLISQDNLFSNVGSFKWEKGSVESQSITADQSTNTVKLDLKGSTLMLDPDKINVKVSGTNYTVVTGKDPASLADNEVLVDATGNLTFKNNLNKGNVVSVDYIADSRTDSATVGKDSTSWKLGKSNIADINSIKVNGTNFTISDDKIINPDDGSEFGTIDKVTGEITFKEKLTDDTKIEINYNENYSYFNIQASTSKGNVQQNFLIAGSDSLNSVIKKVNNSNVGVSMFYDSFTDQMTLSRTETGDFNKSGDEIVTSGAFINDVLQFDDKAVDTNGNLLVKETGGTNAVFVYNGLETERTSNTFSLNGVEFTIKDKFDTPVTVSVSNDSEKVVNNIKEFVELYNTLIDTINKKVTETRYRDYLPLTDDEREQLSDKQQEQWEIKAKSGLLRGDTVLSSALSQMRTSFYQPVNNGNVSSAFNQLAKIGISTTSNYMDGGKLEINEDKLREAIEKDPTSVESLFTSQSSENSSKGIVNRLLDNVSDTINKVSERAGKTYYTNQQFTIGRQLDDVEGKITSFNSRLKDIEDRYYRQFNAMEQAIRKANDQAAYLMQQFGGS
jgi:flagellar hook-associated protein 2